ncbi:MAG: hypothetical protein ACI4RN_07475 [Oscillospiraceae bacterium]
MTKLNKKNVYTIIIVAVLIFIAYICRLPCIAGSFNIDIGVIRSFIYIGLYLAWAFSLRNRIIQTQARRYLTIIAFLMVFWFVIRTVKFHFVSSVTCPNITRYLWYMFYLPMLFIPALAVFVAMSIGKPENYHLPKWTAILYIPTLVLFLLVITNDLHQLVFTFPEDAAVWTDSDNGYALGYYLVAGWIAVNALIILVIMYVKCRIPSRRRRILLPCIPIVILIIYSVLYYSGAEWLRYILGDMTAVICLMYASTLEICIRCRFIQSNTHYRELFDASTVGAQITDNEYNVFLSSKKAKSVDRELLRQTEKGPVMLDGGIRLSGAPIHGGHVIWSEDMSPLLNVLEQLNETKENLEDTNSILEEENAVKTREAHIEEQDRLYNIIQRDTVRQISLLDQLIEQAEETDTDEKRDKLLGKMLVIGSYLKRRSNLVFLADKMSVLESKELALTFGESIDNLELYGVACGFCSEYDGNFLAVHIIAMYDFFEEIVERSLDCMKSLTVYVGKVKDNIFLTINTDSGADFSDLASETVTVMQDEDGEWKLTLHQYVGGQENETA